MLAKTFNCLVTVFLFVFLINAGVTAQHDTLKDHYPTTKIEQDDELRKLIAEGNSEKGITSYTVMQNILASTKLQKVGFDVKVDRMQTVLIEVFNEEGDLIEVVFNDYMAADKFYNFMLDSFKWSGETHYIRVTTEDYVENHSIEPKE